MRHFIRRILASVALVGAAVMLVPAAPAQAGPMLLPVCVEIGTTPGGVRVFDCFWVEVPVLGPRDPWPPDCPECRPGLDFWKDDIDPVVQEKFEDYLGRGLATLAESHLTKDVKLAERLRTEAAGLFLTAAEVAEKHPIELAGVGWYDAKNEKYTECPQPVPWHQGLGAELANGIGLLQAGLADPKQGPQLEEAMKHFDEAYANLAGLAAS